MEKQTGFARKALEHDPLCSTPLNFEVINIKQNACHIHGAERHRVLLHTKCMLKRVFVGININVEQKSQALVVQHLMLREVYSQFYCHFPSEVAGQIHKSTVFLLLQCMF